MGAADARVVAWMHCTRELIGCTVADMLSQHLQVTTTPGTFRRFELRV